VGTTQPGGVSKFARTAAGNLKVDHMTAEVLRAFETAGVPSILLKGPSIVRWLYPGHTRHYGDADLLVPPTARAEAERALGTLGFSPILEEREMPGWWQEHAVEWRRGKELPAVDLHRTLTGAGVADQRLWDVLRANTETMIVGGFPAPVLSVPGRALHLAIHTAQNGADKGDLSLALVRAGAAEWTEARRLAEELEATAAFAAGLRLVPRGHALAARMNLPPTRSVDVALRATGAPAQALTIDRLARASGLRERIAIVRYKLVPPPTFMRHWSKRAQRGRLGLLLAYAERLVWVTRTIPAAGLAWRRARREAQEERTGGG
jgi:hypothetical protein